MSSVSFGQWLLLCRPKTASLAWFLWIVATLQDQTGSAVLLLRQTTTSADRQDPSNDQKVQPNDKPRFDRMPLTHNATAPQAIRYPFGPKSSSHPNSWNQSSPSLRFLASIHNEFPEYKPPKKCACQPVAWELVLDFSHATCRSTNVPLNVPSHIPGLDSVTCREDPEPREYEHDDALEYVSDVQIREYDQNHILLIRPHLQLPGHFINGEYFFHHSILSVLDTNTCTPDTCDMPRYVVFTFKTKTKRNQCERDFEITWKFNSKCNTQPLVRAGQYVGPLTVVRDTNRESERETRVG